jgi:lipopolysaccharide biosynthesis glycosyltransferase
MKDGKKYAVMTINIGKPFADLGEQTMPLMKNYAETIGADFVVIDQVKQKHPSQYSAYWAKFQLYNFFDRYDRILFLDLDVLIYPHCPNIFAVVPEDKFGALLETDYGVDQIEEILEIQARVKDIGWRKDYFNVGVMVASKAHKEVFNLQHGSDGGQKYPEQTQINYNVQRFNIPIFKLDYRFNHTYFFGGNHDARGFSYIVHYAAITHEIRVPLIREDIGRYYAGKPPLPDHEFEIFLKQNFPGKNRDDLLKAYHLLRDPEAGI